MGNNINVILGSSGACCLCSDVPHCGDCKKGPDEPPEPGEPCNCNEYGAYNIPTCKGDCLRGCEECTFAFACPNPNDSHGCYQCISTCSCESGGEYALGTDCAALGFDGSEPATVTCSGCPPESCTHCYCLPCSEHDYVDCGQTEKLCDSKKSTPVPPFPGSECPFDCCQCTGVDCGVCDFEDPPCACCPSETGTGDCCGSCCCGQGEAPIIDAQGSCICVPSA